MFFYFLLFINCTGLVVNLSITDFLFQSKLRNSSVIPNQNNSFKNNSIHINWQDILFISSIILLFILLIICLYFQRSVINFLFNLFSKPDNNDRDMNEHAMILHRVRSLKNVNPMYLTVPQSPYLPH